jgi:phosphopentomutase
MTSADTVAQDARRGRMLCLVARYMFCPAQLSLLDSGNIEIERTLAIVAIA